MLSLIVKNGFSVFSDACNTSPSSFLCAFSYWHCTPILVLCPRGQYLRITSTLYVALISPTLLNTRHVYFPLSSGFKFFKFSVHFFFLFSPISCGVRGLLSFSQVMSGRGFPLATHFRRTELPTGRAITLRLILAGCVNLGRAAKDIKHRL